MSISVTDDKKQSLDVHSAQASKTVGSNNSSVCKVRVCHVSMCLLTGGLERLLVEFSRLYDHDRFDLQFATLGEIGQPADDIRGFDCKVTQVNDGSVKKFKQISRLVDLFKKEEIQVVHTHNTYAHFYGTLAARMAAVPVVVNSQHGRGCGPNWKARMQFRIANLMADRILGVSDDAAELCRGQNRFSAKKIETLWNGIDLERFAFHGPKHDGPAIAVARLSPEKDFSTLIKAVAKVIPHHPSFKLQIVGDGSERNKLEALASELGIQNHITFLGERKDVPSILKESSFYVGSSKTEGISLTLLEAMAVGLPVVTTDVGGNPEVVVEDKTGLLVPSENPIELANAICKMLDASNRWDEMSQTARERVESEFNIRRMISDYEKLYITILREKGLHTGR